MTYADSWLLVSLGALLGCGSSSPSHGGSADGGAHRGAGQHGDGAASPDGHGDDARRSDVDARADGSAAALDSGDWDAPPLCKKTPSGMVSLPMDDAFHAGQELEWWYWSGHLEAADGRWFGFEETFFAGVQSGVMGEEVDVALTDIQGAQFLYNVTDQLGAPVHVSDGFQLAVSGQTATGGNGRDVLHGAPPGATFDLTLDSEKAPVLQYGDGYTTYSPSGFTYYYSREWMAATGTVVVGSESIPVTGHAWFDHQWGQLDAVVQRGWQWFAIQLDDGRELMLYVMLVNGQPIAPSGSLLDANCNVTYLSGSDVEFASTGTWTSPHTQCTYPAGWQITYGDLTMTVTPTLQDQELYSGMQKYWEGASTVTGTATGRAYVELNGYCN
jgi:predicted secreted hydrolase